MKAHSEDGFSCRHAVVVEKISCDADTNRKDAAYKMEWQCSTICQKLWCIPGRIYRRFEEKREALRGPRKARHSTSSRGKNSSRSLPLTKKIRSFCRRRRQRAKKQMQQCAQHVWSGNKPGRQEIPQFPCSGISLSYRITG